MMSHSEHHGADRHSTGMRKVIVPSILLRDVKRGTNRNGNSVSIADEAQAFLDAHALVAA